MRDKTRTMTLVATTSAVVNTLMCSICDDEATLESHELAGTMITLDARANATVLRSKHRQTGSREALRALVRTYCDASAAIVSAWQARCRGGMFDEFQRVLENQREPLTRALGAVTR